MIFTEQLNNWYLRTSVDFTEYDFKIAISPFKTDVSAFKLKRSCNYYNNQTSMYK